MRKVTFDGDKQPYRVIAESAEMTAPTKTRHSAANAFGYGGSEKPPEATCAFAERRKTARGAI